MNGRSCLEFRLLKVKKNLPRVQLFESKFRRSRIAHVEVPDAIPRALAGTAGDNPSNLRGFAETIPAETAAA
jgi:hypothetical protein